MDKTLIFLVVLIITCAHTCRKDENCPDKGHNGLIIKNEPTQGFILTSTGIIQIQLLENIIRKRTEQMACHQAKILPEVQDLVPAGNLYL
mgnify:CR=1 FL=1